MICKIFQWAWRVDSKYRIKFVRRWNVAVLQNKLTLKEQEGTYRIGIIEDMR